jgi:hypothetical protein
MGVSCAEHRETLRLLALKQRLIEEDLDPEEKKDLEEEAALLEAKLGMD